MIDGKRINGYDGPVKHLDENLNTNLIIICAIAAGLSLIPGFVGAAIAAKVFLCSWWGSFAMGAGGGAVAGAGIGTGASFIASNMYGIAVKSLLGKYIPICVVSGILGALIGASVFASIGESENDDDLTKPKKLPKDEVTRAIVEGDYEKWDQTMKKTDPTWEREYEYANNIYLDPSYSSDLSGESIKYN